MLIDDGFLSSFRATDKKKENEMMDLNGSKVGDKFNCENGHRPELVFISEGNYCFSLNGELFLYKADGQLVQHISENGEHLVSKHDSRWWLKKLPDADLFNDGWLAIHSDEGWYWFKKEPVNNGEYYHTNGMFAMTPIMGIKMPKLTGDEWKQSKISIADLRDWQKANR